jgi:hypothetical protein
MVKKDEQVSRSYGETVTSTPQFWGDPDHFMYEEYAKVQYVRPLPFDIVQCESANPHLRNNAWRARCRDRAARSVADCFARNRNGLVNRLDWLSRA